MHYTNSIVQLDNVDFLTTMINQETLEYGCATPFAFCIHDKNDTIIAGCNGPIIYGCIYTDQLWVHPDYRQQGLGQKLMNYVHDHGRKQGYTITTVNIMSFKNAEMFYKKLGYGIDFVRDGYVNNSQCIFMKRAL